MCTVCGRTADFSAINVHSRFIFGKYPYFRYLIVSEARSAGLGRLTSGYPIWSQPMTEINATSFLQKSCLVWSSRRERNIALRVYYDLREQDGCRMYTIGRIEEAE